MTEQALLATREIFSRLHGSAPHGLSEIECMEIIRRHAPDMTRLEAELDRMRKAVKFYAARETWATPRSALYSLALGDYGDAARDALKDTTATAGK